MCCRILFIITLFALSLNGAMAQKSSEIETRRNLNEKKPRLREIKNLKKCFEDTCMKRDEFYMCQQAIPLAMDEFFSKYASEQYFGGTYENISQPISYYAQDQLKREREEEKKPRKKWQIWKKKKNMALLAAPPAMCNLPKLKKDFMVFSPVPKNIKCKVKNGKVKVSIVLDEKEREKGYFSVIKDSSTNHGDVSFHLNKETNTVNSVVKGDTGGSYVPSYCYVVAVEQGLRFDCTNEVKVKYGFLRARKRKEIIHGRFEIAENKEKCDSHAKANEEVHHIAGTDKDKDLKGGSGETDKTKADPYDPALPNHTDPNKKVDTK